MDEERKTINRLKIMINAHLKLWNLIKLKRLWEASEISYKLSGILKCWAKEDEEGKEIKS